MQTIYQTLLVLHIAGVISAIGTLLSGLVAYNQFWKLYGISKEQGISAFNYFLKTRTVGLLDCWQ